MKNSNFCLMLLFCTFCCFYLVEAEEPGSQTAPAAEKTKVRIAQTMSPQEAAEMLRRLYSVEELNPFVSPYAWPGYDLSADKSFGFVLSNGSHLLGISEKRDFLQLVDNQGKPLGVNIGLLYSESAFHVGGKEFEKGTYYVHVGHDKLTIVGGQKGKTGSQSVDFGLKVDDVYLQRTGAKADLSIIQDADDIFLICERNKFTIIIKP